MLFVVCTKRSQTEQTYKHTPTHNFIEFCMSFHLSFVKFSSYHNMLILLIWIENFCYCFVYTVGPYVCGIKVFINFSFLSNPLMCFTHHLYWWRLTPHPPHSPPIHATQSVLLLFDFLLSLLLLVYFLLCIQKYNKMLS